MSATEKGIEMRIIKVTNDNKMEWPAAHISGSRFLVGTWLVIDESGTVRHMFARKSDAVATVKGI